MLKAVPDQKESLLAGYFKPQISHTKNKRIVALILLSYKFSIRSYKTTVNENIIFKKIH